MNADTVVLIVLLVVYSVGLPVVIILDPAHLRDAHRAELRSQR